MPTYIDAYCQICNKLFKARKDRIKRGWSKFCSRKCQGIYFKTALIGTNNPNYRTGTHQLKYTKCKSCGKTFPFIKRGALHKGYFCSTVCMGNFYKNHPPHNMFLSFETHPSYKGGIMISKGRCYILKRKHPYANKRGYILKSRLIMEEYLGRYLTKKEVIHHLNNIKDDDRIENLVLFPSQKEHVEFHNKEAMKKFEEGKKEAVIPSESAGQQ